jgi:hypothetical protein
MNGTSVVRASDEDVRRRGEELAEFERLFAYPLGDGMFRIDHGADYLAFFRGLGEPSTWIAEVEGRIAGLLVAVRRLMPEPTWYLCDLKAAPRALGAGRLLLAAFEREWGRGQPAYGVSMDPAVGQNRLARATRRCTRVGVENGPQISFWMLDLDGFHRVEQDLIGALGPVGFYDPEGVKDIVLLDARRGARDGDAWSGRRLPLLHVQHGPLNRPNVDAPRADHVLMLCLPSAHPMAAHLRTDGFHPDATATVLHHGMGGYDWASLLTSDI